MRKKSHKYKKVIFKEILLITKLNPLIMRKNIITRIRHKKMMLELQNKSHNYEEIS